MQIENIPYKEYITIEDKRELNYILQYGKVFQISYDHLDIGDFMELPFGTVKDIQYDFDNEIRWNRLIDYYSELSGKTHKQIGNMGILEITQEKNFFVEQINNINLIENNGLGHEPTEEQKEVGIDRFRDLGQYLQFRSLTLGDITKLEAIRNIKYKYCFTELMASKMINEYENDLMEYRNRKDRAI